MGKVTKSQKPNCDSSIGDRIRYIRTKQGISQDELGGRISKSRVEINYYENDTRLPDVQTLINIANSLEVSMDYLCGLNDIEKPTIEYQAINEIIGLNEDSIYRLSKFNQAEKIAKDSGMEDYEYAGVENEKIKLEMVNQLLSSNDFEQILSIMIEYKKIIKQIDTQPTSLSFERLNKEHLIELKELNEIRMLKRIIKTLCNEN